MFSRFAINLTFGHTHNDIALHLNPRLPQNYIVRNSKINGRWGKEETTASLPFKLKRGQQFAIQILVTNDSYLVSVNGLHFCQYAHRMPYQRVTCVQVRGSISDAMIEQLPIKAWTNLNMKLFSFEMTDSFDWFLNSIYILNSFKQEYPERTEQSDIVHTIDLIDSFDRELIKSDSEIVSVTHSDILSFRLFFNVHPILYSLGDAVLRKAIETIDQWFSIAHRRTCQGVAVFVLRESTAKWYHLAASDHSVSFQRSFHNYRRQKCDHQEFLVGWQMGSWRAQRNSHGFHAIPNVSSWNCVQFKCIPCLSKW